MFFKISRKHYKDTKLKFLLKFNNFIFINPFKYFIAYVLDDIVLIVFHCICSTIHLAIRWSKRIVIVSGILYLIIYYILVRQQKFLPKGTRRYIIDLSMVVDWTPPQLD